MNPQTYVLGDLHGNARGLSEVLNKVNFNYELDTLYFIGDLCDGVGNEPHKCLLKLLSIKNLYVCTGNHDLWLRRWVFENHIDKNWIKSGGLDTIFYLNQLDNPKQLLKQFFDKAKYWYYVDGVVICHAGFNLRRPITNQKELLFCINRDLYKKAHIFAVQHKKICPRYDIKNTKVIKTIIIGHTPTKDSKPEFLSNLINIDTGSAHYGKLTLMNLKTKEYVQSGWTAKLYGKKEFLTTKNIQINI